MMVAIIGGKKKDAGDDERIGGYGREEASDADDADPMADDEPITSEEARMEAAKAAIRAMRMGDAKALDEALAAHYEACGK